MNRWRLAVLLVVALAAVPACADDDPKDDDDTNGSPLAPTLLPLPVTPRAQLLANGLYTFDQCQTATMSCRFNGLLQNVGSGCAIRVEGIVRLFDSFGFQVGSHLSLRAPGPADRATARARGLHRFNFVPVSAAQLTQTYRHGNAVDRYAMPVIRWRRASMCGCGNGHAPAGAQSAAAEPHRREEGIPLMPPTALVKAPDVRRDRARRSRPTSSR